MEILADATQSWYLPKEHETRLEDGFILPLQAIQVAFGQACNRTLCQHPWWWLQYQFRKHSCPRAIQ